jgi:L-ascorbate metabolism protein UlaG (beta-lactamase superfamily)
MKIKYLAHAAFLITAENGVKIITDPYNTGHGFKYAAIQETADIVTVSHEHGDHNNTGVIQGNPQVLRTGGEVKGIKIKATAAAHDDINGSQRGKNTIFCLNVDGVNVCHLGDLGHELSAAQLIDIGPVDVLIIPVGGFFTIDADTATKVSSQIKPKIIIPMHYKTDKADLPIKGVDEFLKGKSGVNQSNKSEIEVKAGNLPKTAQIIVLVPSL